jgi:hypothetical protein
MYRNLVGIWCSFASFSSSSSQAAAAAAAAAVKVKLSHRSGGEILRVGPFFTSVDIFLTFSHFFFSILLVWRSFIKAAGLCVWANMAPSSSIHSHVSTPAL